MLKILDDPAKDYSEPQSNVEPTTYQRRYLIYCDVEGKEPGSFPVREFVAWATSKIQEFKASRGWDRWRRLSDQDQLDFDEFLRKEKRPDHAQEILFRGSTDAEWYPGSYDNNDDAVHADICGYIYIPWSHIAEWKINK